MIFDVLENAHKYKTLHKNFSTAFQFLAQTGLSELSEGKYPIDGEAVFAIVAKDQGRSKENAQLEAHNKYIDIQFVLGGIDEMGWRTRSTCKKAVAPYDPEADIQFFTDPPTAWFATQPGQFAVFFPEDAHLPLIAKEMIHKIIVKIAV